jgi:hypothetical protein
MLRIVSLLKQDGEVALFVNMEMPTAKKYLNHVDVENK